MMKKKGKKSKGTKLVSLDMFEDAHSNVQNLALSDNVDIVEESDENIHSKVYVGKKKPGVNAPSTSLPARLPGNLGNLSAKSNSSSGSIAQSRKVKSPGGLAQSTKRKEIVPDNENYFSISKAMELKLALINEGVTDLDFYGNSQLTDLVFYVMMVTNKTARFDLSGSAGCSTKCDKLTDLKLSGCYQLTDFALLCIAKLCPNLQSIDLTGCRHVTESGLYQLVERCTKLKKVDLPGTNVTILPLKAATLDVSRAGFPCISPQIEMLMKNGPEIMNASSYKKPANEDIMKICVIQGPEATHSLIKYLNKEKNTTFNHLGSHSQFPVNERFKAEIVECHESICDYFITKRTLYVFTVSEGCDVKSTASRIFGHMCQIINKVTYAAFVIAGIKSGKGELPLDKILTEVMATAKTKSTSLRRSKETEFTEVHGTMTKKVTEKLYTGITEQESAMSAIVLANALETISVSSWLVDLSKPFTGAEALKPVISGLTTICQLYPEFQDLAGPTYKFLQAGSVQAMLKPGIVSMESGTSGTQIGIDKYIELSTFMGAAVVFKLLDDTHFVCLIDWLAKFVSMAFSPPVTSVNNGRIHSLDDKVPIWSPDDLKAALGKVVDNTQLENGIATLQQLGLSVYPSVFVAFKDLPTQPPIRLDQMFPEIPAYGQRKDTFYTVGYQASFVSPVPSFVMRQLLMYCSKLRRWSMAWKTGFAIQEGIVETLVEWREDRGDTSTISLYCHSVKQHQGDTILGKIEQMVWNSALQFKIVLEFVFKQYNLPTTLKLIMGKEISNPVDIVTSHRYQQEEDSHGKTTQVCSTCGITPKQNCIVWVMKNSICNRMLKDEDLSFTGNTTGLCGGIVRIHKEGTAYILSETLCNLQTTFRMQLLSGSVENLKIGVGRSGVFKRKKKLLERIYVDFGKKKIVMDKSEGDKYIEVKSLPVEFVPDIGDDFCISTQESQGRVSGLIKFYRNHTLLEKLEYPNCRVMPFIENCGDSTVEVLIHPFDEAKMSTNTEVVAGMRLEALDLKTPSLVCVATVQEVQADGNFLIHFDGWTKTYDYVCKPDFKDIHPVGWMEANMTKYKKLRQELQRPNGYQKAFTWPTYCEEVDSLPVPFDFFTEEQIGDATFEEYYRILEKVDAVDYSSSRPCSGSNNRAKVLEFQTMSKCKNPQHVFEFFMNHSKLFSVLPQNFSLMKLKHPCLGDIMDFSKQNVHILCPGLKMELLHFLDDAGVPLTQFEPFTDAQNAAFLQNCIMGLLMQEDTLPKNCSKLIPGIEKLEDQDICELWLKKLLFLYMCVLQLHVTTVKKVTMSRDALELFNTTVKSKQLENLISEGDRYVKCKGHMGSSMANSTLREIPMEMYTSLYMFMTRLDFQNNMIHQLPQDFFKQFKALEYLNVSKNGIAELPGDLGQLQELTELDISSNRLEKLPDELGKLDGSLLILKISNNKLNCIPASVFKLTKLEELEAENIGEIKDLSSLKNLKGLLSLNLGLNHISKIPQELGDLPLNYLDLSGVPWIAQTTYQSYMAFVKTLNGNHVTSKIEMKEQSKMFKSADVDESSTLTPDEVTTLNNEMIFPKYPRFGVGDFKFEKTGGIPPVILKLTTLKKLVLRYHGITHIPDDIQCLTSLTELDVSYNPKMKALTAELGGLPLKQVHLLECLALNTPPKEVVARGHLAVMGYLKRLRLGAVPCRRTKLMMVGLGGAGKTSLVQSLMNNRYRAYMDHDEPITDGIDITKWEVDVGGDDGKLTFSVWDFAGQTVYYNTHQFFLSNRAVYLLLWNVRQGYEHAGLDFWLSSIACHAPKAPILVVGTHIDKVEKYRLPEESLKARYPQIVAFHYVSSFTGTGVKELSKTIIQNTLQQKYMGEKVPEAWLTLEKRLIAYREEKNKDILPFKILEGISASCGIFDKAELVQSVQFLHDLGAVQFFDTDFLRQMIVIYPQWIVDVMACLVTVHQGVVEEGRMNIKDLDKIWTNYPTDLHPWLLRLTEEFDLTCPLGNGDISIVPCLLPDTEPKYDWPHADPAKNIRESMTLYKFQYLPAGLFNRAQVRLHAYSQGALLWKTGSFMKKNDHIALMIQTDDQELIVRAQGFRPENFLFIVHEMIETLTAESYAGVQYDFYIPCMDCQNRNVKDPSMMSHQKVQRALELSVPFLQCEKFFHMLSLQELKDAMPSDKMSEVDSHLRNSVRELIDLTNEKTVSVFFVYSGKDVPDLANQEKVVHPGTVMEDLRSQDAFKMSYTDKPETSDMEALTLSMKANDVIIFGLSDQFAENTDCRKLLLYTKEVLQRPILLLLLGTTKAWQKGELGMPLGDEVFVDMTKKERYPHKIKELYEAIQKKDESKKKVKEQAPDCFISYCWTNSHDAIAKGSRNKEGALGWSGGDPREVKKFLTEKGISCWLDIEKVGGVGLYTSIADGLREAKVVLAFVSDEYVESKNCVMEFRQSLITCRIPVIVVAVGTGYKWEENEVGMMAVGHKCPKVNMQFDNQAGYLQILNLVQEQLSHTSSDKQKGQDIEKQRNIAFQEVLELTQRKFLRHITNSFITNDLEPYPSLFVVDFISDKERKDYETAQKASLAVLQGQKVSEVEKSEEMSQKEDAGPVEELPDLNTKYCIRLLCEHTEGWHVVPSYIPFPDMDQEEEQLLLDSSASYLTRVYTIIKYSNILLECVTTPEGEIFQQRMEDIGIKSGGDFKQEYLTLRNMVMQQDKTKAQTLLKRCHVNGKNVWLCKFHKKASRSKTEQMFAEDDSSIPLPSGGDGFVAMEPEAMEAVSELSQPATKAANAPKKLFRRNISDSKPASMKRQTSQACSVM